MSANTLKSEKYEKAINDYIEKNEQAIIKSLQELIKIRSVKGEKADGCPFGEGSATALNKGCDIAKDCGLSVTNIDNYAAYADLKGIEEKPYLGILSHLDVVPEGNGWTKDPFGGEILNGCIIGRGAIDDKGPTVSVLYALKAIKECKIPLLKTVRLIMGCDEETGSDEDIGAYRAKEKMPPFVFTPDADFPLINGEKGMIRAEFTKEIEGDVLFLKGGEVINAVPSYCECEIKGLTAEAVTKAAKSLDIAEYVTVKAFGDNVKVVVKGVNAHASTPENGTNANTIMFTLLAGLPIKENQVFNDISKAFSFGDNHGTGIGIAMSDEVSGKLTCVLSIAELSDGKISCEIDIRFPVTKTKEQVLEKLKKGLAKNGLTLAEARGSEPHYTDDKTDFVQTLLSTYEKHTGKKGYCFSIGGGTYVHDIKGGVAFGVCVEGEDNHMHGADEFITIKALKENAKLFAKAIINICC